MSAQSEFVGNFKSVMVHLIKHDQILYRKFAGTIEAVDGEGWADYSPEQKQAAVSDIRAKLPLLDDYYAQYPHNWSRDRYDDFKKAMEAYERELLTS